MKTIKRLYHFLGSIHFAIALIASVTIFVIAGTFIESVTDSHRYAARYTYNNPIFLALLGLFFINILFAATRRWPFKLKHVPFLITHLGLLMILSGTAVKSRYGVQGTMGILEGASSDKIFSPESYAIKVQSPELDCDYALKRSVLGHLTDRLEATDVDRRHPDLKLELLGMQAHCEELMQFWIKENEAVISGLPPIPLVDLEPGASVAISLRAPLNPGGENWNLAALRCSDSGAAARNFYINATAISLEPAGIVLPLAVAIEEGIPFENRVLAVKLDFDMDRPSIHLYDGDDEVLELLLSGPRAGLCLNTHNSAIGFSQTIELERKRSLLFAQSKLGVDELYAFYENGAILHQSFDADKVTSFIVYDKGFRGYGVGTELPPPYPKARHQDHIDAHLHAMKSEINAALASGAQLPPPLEFLEEATNSHGMQLTQVLASFLREWNRHDSLLYPKKQTLPQSLTSIMAALSLGKLDRETRKALLWVSLFDQELTPRIASGESLLDVLNEMQWPMVEQLKQQHGDQADDRTLIRSLQQQIFAVSGQLPYPDFEISPGPELNAHIFSAYLSAYGICLENLMSVEDDVFASRWENYMESRGEDTQVIELECPLSFRYEPRPPLAKLEENIALIHLKVSDDNGSEEIRLAHDRFGNGFKWPVLNGRYLLRFQPEFQRIPYRVRLQDTRQINYANSQQAFSYESSVIITAIDDKGNPSGPDIEKTISMNNVHESWDGFRFYMANISPPGETQAQRAQIVVNHDPAKYTLTYPGALVMSLGIVLLFWFWPYGSIITRPREKHSKTNGKS